jgi:hypothetical protein
MGKMKNLRGGEQPDTRYQIPDAGGGEKRELGAGKTGRRGEGEWGMGRLGEGEVWKELKRRGWGAPRRG